VRFGLVLQASLQGASRILLLCQLVERSCSGLLTLSAVQTVLRSQLSAMAARGSAAHSFHDADGHDRGARYPNAWVRSTQPNSKQRDTNSKHKCSP
jgi:hypothetical protein